MPEDEERRCHRMSEAEKRRKDRQELHEMFREIEPAKNEDIARRAISIADYYLVKVENQARHIQDLEARYRRAAPCDVCRHNPPSSGDGKPCCMCPAEKAFWKEGADG